MSSRVVAGPLQLAGGVPAGPVGPMGAAAAAADDDDDDDADGDAEDEDAAVAAAVADCA